MRDVERESTQARRDERVGEFLEALIGGAGVRELDEGVLTGFTIRMPTEEDPSVLVIVRACGVDGRVVAFVGGPTVPAAVLSWRAKSAAGRMKWREDVPWQQRNGRGIM